MGRIALETPLMFPFMARSSELLRTRSTCIADDPIALTAVNLQMFAGFP
jgi:hypothetical protein